MIPMPSTDTGNDIIMSQCKHRVCDLLTQKVIANLALFCLLSRLIYVIFACLQCK